MKILANDGLSPIGKQLLEQAGYAVITEHIQQDDLIHAIQKENYQILLVRSATKVRQNLIDACPNLLLIGRGGVGMDNIDVEYAQNKGIKVVNTPDSSSQSVAELVIASMLSISRFLHNSYCEMPKGDFSALKKRYAKGVELRGKTLGIIGFGRIGQTVASYALGMGMEVLAVDHKVGETTIQVAIGKNQHVDVPISTTTDLYSVLNTSDYLSIHVPKQRGENVLIGREEFAQMKDGIRIVHAARGGVVDEAALLEALESGKVARCALDVFEDEPFPNKALLNHPQIACTPHIGASTVEAQARIGQELAQIIMSQVPILEPSNT